MPTHWIQATPAPSKPTDDLGRVHAATALASAPPSSSTAIWKALRATGHLSARTIKRHLVKLERDGKVRRA